MTAVSVGYKRNNTGSRNRENDIGESTPSGSLEDAGPDFFWESLSVAGTKRFSLIDFTTGGTNNSQENCSTTGVHQVTAGTHVFALAIRGRDAVSFSSASVWALFVPFDGNGNTP